MDETKHSARDAAHYDLVLVGGGLQNGLMALGCFAHRPGVRIAMVERCGELGGSHTWSIHPYDVPPEARAFVADLIEYRWSSYDVRFPTFGRTLHAPYAAITSHRFARTVRAAFSGRPSSQLRLGCEVSHVGARHVGLTNGEQVHGSVVIDARGPHTVAGVEHCGFQKFLGLELEFEREHGVARPILIDATVPQVGGFRFFYVLPFTRRRLLVEDTTFSRSPVLDEERARGEVLAYAAQFGRVAQRVREERGVLPMPWRSSAPAAPASPLPGGYQGGWFHPATGYSFPAAVRLACHVAAYAQDPEGVLGPELARLQREQRSQVRYAEQLNRLLFTCFAPEAMWHVFARFYRLPDVLIHRFYALSLTPLDRARILVGRPPRGFSLAHALSGVP
jgi:lycopene beta-cyclase